MASRSAVRSSAQPIHRHLSAFTSRPRQLIQARSVVTPTASRSRPVAALANATEPHDYYAHNHEPPPLEPLRPDISPPPLHAASRSLRPQMVYLPSPPPPMQVQDRQQAELFPSSGSLDTLSSISICLRSPENLPRAHALFQRLIKSSRSTRSPLPNEKIWARLVRAMGSVRDDVVGSKQAKHLRDDATRLAKQWHDLQTGGGSVAPVSEKIYQSLFIGLVEAGAKLDCFTSLLTNQTLAASSLLSGLEVEDPEIFAKALLQHAEKHGLSSVAEQVQNQDRSSELLRGFPEIKPVLESHGRRHRPGQPVSEPEEADQARFSITNLRDTLSHIATPLDPVSRQLRLELSSLDSAQEALQHSVQVMRDQGLDAVLQAQRFQQGRLQSWMNEWLDQLTPHLERCVKEMRERVASKPSAGPATGVNKYASLEEEILLHHLSSIPTAKLALVTILEMMRFISTGEVHRSVRVARVSMSLGHGVETEYHVDAIRKIRKSGGPQSARWQEIIDPKTKKPKRILIDQVWQKYKENGGSENGSMKESPIPAWTPPWTQVVKSSVGSFLLDALLRSATVTRTAPDPLTGDMISEEQSAFSHSYEYIHGRKAGIIQVNPEIVARLLKEPIRSFSVARQLPMLIPPIPWRWDGTAIVGGYIGSQVEVMRFKENVEQANFLTHAAVDGRLDGVFHGLNVLSQTPWRVNASVFDVILRAWNNGEAIADIPPSAEKGVYDFPPRPSSADGDPDIRRAYVARCRAIMRQQQKDHGERCKFNYHIEVARSFLHDTFYLPHTMDFRGRAYPTPPNLSTVGDDLCRGLLLFGEGKALGPTGLNWLRVHLANVYGYDKATFAERIQFAKDHQADILDSAENPLDGARWWLKAEDPWQCLATCIDLAGALRHRDSAQYISALPVHQDGTCNGMQHYAALGGDVRGAQAVNLTNGERPADLYSGVATLVNQVIDKDRAAGVKAAGLIADTVGRKIIKQTVMTTVYGVTYVGAREQIARQLKLKGDIAPENVYIVSAYLAKIVLACIGDLFSRAKDIMAWLTTSARLISSSIPPDRFGASSRHTNGRQKKPDLTKNLMTSVTWTTPLGLPVVQPYRKDVKKQVLTALQTIFIADKAAPSEVLPGKQASAFPPNFIHSLDATHMLLTAVACQDAGLTFASVHDSYWTHASSIETMSEILRANFIKLHSANIIGDVQSEFLSRFGDQLIRPSRAQEILENRPGNAGRLAMDAAHYLAVEANMNKAKQDEPASVATVKALQDQKSTPTNPPVKASVLLRQKEATVSRATPELKSPRTTTDWVKLRDVLPLAPERGQFDVKNVGESLYFFS